MARGVKVHPDVIKELEKHAPESEEKPEVKLSTMPWMHVKVDQKVVDEICRHSKYFDVTPDAVVNDILKLFFARIDSQYMDDKVALNG